MLRLELEIISYSDKDKIDGFTLGHMTISGSQGLATSKGIQPNQSMMIFLSIIELLDGIRQFILAKNVSNYRFVGIDSSFQFSMTKQECGRIRLTGSQGIIDEVETIELSQSIWKGVSAFLYCYEPFIRPDDPVADDLHFAVDSFKSALVPGN